MTERLNEIFSDIPECEVFADVGCDHGYIAKSMLKSGKCRKAIISDISEKSLSKAEKLLKKEIEKGSAIPVVSDGLKDLPPCDCALIAGLGGEEIIRILSDAPYLPESLVLQPMKNVKKVREYAVFSGYAILSDRVFKEGYMFYDLITLKKGKDTLTEEEAEFGRSNIQHPSAAFSDKMRWEIRCIDERIENGGLKKHVLAEFLKRREILKKYV